MWLTCCVDLSVDTQRLSAFTRRSGDGRILPPSSFTQPVSDYSASPEVTPFSDSINRSRNTSSVRQRDHYDESPSASSGGSSVPPPFKLTTSPEGAQSVPSMDVPRPSQSAGAQNGQNFQTQVIRNLISEELEDFKDQIHRDIVQLQVEMLRQFQIQMVGLCHCSLHEI